MKRINILTVNNNPNSLSFVFPFLVNKVGLKERGIKARFFYGIKDDLYDCDAVFIDNKFFTPNWHRVGEGFQHLQKKKEEDIFITLKKARERTGAVLWFDNSDSTGTPQFEVLPYVDGYYKSAVLKDRSLYCKNFYRDRIFFDYYHKKFGINDDFATAREYLPDAAHLKKIHLSWNPALNNHSILGNTYSRFGKLVSRMRRFLPVNFRYTARFARVGRLRRIDIAARIGLTHPRKFVHFHRRMLTERLARFKIDTRFASHTLYYKELQNAKLSISPFGLGEISYRDFESIICGALLIKPDMDHLRTWPDLYRDGETYVKCSWDFSDIGDKIDHLFSNPKRVAEIAKEAQRNYRYYLFGGGRDDFCDRIDEITQRHKSSSLRAPRSGAKQSGMVSEIASSPDVASRAPRKDG